MTEEDRIDTGQPDTDCMDAEWIDTVGLDDLWEGDMVGVDVAGTSVLLVNLDGTVLAFENRCPHQGSLLSEGFLDGKELTCSRHLWCFDVTTGGGVNPANSQLVCFEAKVVGERVLVRRPDRAS